MKALIKTIEVFGKMGNDTLDNKATKACREFDPDTQDPVTFLRNLRDLCVRYSWSSGAIITATTVALDSVGLDNEDPGEMAARRKLLEKGGSDINYLLNAKPEPGSWEPAPPPEPPKPVVPTMTVAEALDLARKHHAEGKERKALNVIFDVIDDHHLAGDFQSVDEALKDLDPDTLSIGLQIGVLSITLTAKAKLPSRPDFFERVKTTLQGETPGRQEGLLKGLQ